MQGPYGYYNPNFLTTAMNVNTQMTEQPISVPQVNGLEGAKAYQMPPNSSILLLDTTQPVVWLKTTDAARYPNITGYDITPQEIVESKEPATDERFESLEKRIEQLERRMKNAKSNNSSVKSNNPKQPTVE